MFDENRAPRALAAICKDCRVRCPSSIFVLSCTVSKIVTGEKANIENESQGILCHHSAPSVRR
jgi:hypothetical protein